QSLAKIFCKYGLQAEFATSGQEALLKLQSFRPDVLITDILMPEMDGVELALRVASQLPGCKIILFSGHAEHANLLKLKEANLAFLLISKPLSPAMLIKLSLAESATKLPNEAVVLLVDENEAQRYSMSQILEKAGFRVMEASTGRECVEKASSRPD